MRRQLWLVGPVVYFLSFACYDAPVEAPMPKITQQTYIPVPQSKANKVDVLFLIDNSPSMEPMASALRQRFDQFLQPFQDAATNNMQYADMHIGVVTSDFGAGNGKAGGCQPYGGGDAGKLQTVGQGGGNCQGPTGGLPYIQFSFDPAATTNNVTATALVDTFTCMASVGSLGCGFEHQLEAVYAALHNNEQGFLRDDALLAVVFVTNEDDGSAPPDSTFYDTSTTAQGPQTTYRQSMYGVVCGEPPMTLPNGAAPGPLHMCAPAPNPSQGPALEFDVSRYVDYLTKASTTSVKPDPEHQVILVGIDALYDESAGLLVELDNPPAVSSQSYTPCATLDENGQPACDPFLQHSCQNAEHPEFFGDPAVRLNSVIQAAATNVLASICDSDYSTALKTVADKIRSGLPDGCITAPLTSTDAPDCIVEDLSPDGSVTDLPNCSSGAIPCWTIGPNPKCDGKSPQGLGLTIDRGGQDAPQGTVARVFCTTVAGPSSDGGN